MVGRLALLYVLNIAIDCIILSELRELVYSFLLSKRNIKGAKKIHSLQSRRDRFTLSYIKNYAIFPKEFRFFQKCWIAEVASIIPQYIALVVVNFISSSTTVVVLFVLFVTKIALQIALYTQFSNKISKYDKRNLIKRFDKK